MHLGKERSVGFAATISQCFTPPRNTVGLSYWQKDGTPARYRQWIAVGIARKNCAQAVFFRPKPSIFLEQILPDLYFLSKVSLQHGDQFRFSGPRHHGAKGVRPLTAQQCGQDGQKAGLIVQFALPNHLIKGEVGKQRGKFRIARVQPKGIPGKPLLTVGPPPTGPPPPGRPRRQSAGRTASWHQEPGPGCR